MWIFFFKDTAPTEIYTLSLHDALPISISANKVIGKAALPRARPIRIGRRPTRSDRAPMNGVTAITATADRKSTRLNSSHSQISYAVFCLKKKKHDSTTNWRAADRTPNG